MMLIIGTQSLACLNQVSAVTWRSEESVEISRKHGTMASDG